MKRIRDVAGRSVLVSAALAVILSGCSALSPSTTSEPYAASDGANLDLPGTSVALRNFIVIGAAKGDPAVVVGAVINSGSSPVEVSFQADLGATAQPTATSVTVGPNSSVQLGPEQAEQIEIPQLPVEPGATTRLSAATVSGGRAEIVVPVLRPQDEYSALTPAPTTEAPTPTATPSETATTGKKSKSKPKSSDSPTATPSETPTNS